MTSVNADDEARASTPAAFGWAWQQFSAVTAARGTAIAAFHGAAAIRFDELAARAEAWSATFDLAPGDRVLVAAENCLELLACIPGIWRRGGIVVLVHADAHAQHLEHAVRVTSPAWVVVDAGVATPAQVRSRVLADGPTHSVDAKPAVGALAGAAPASVLFTSGSTGLPKGVTQSAHNLADGAHRIAALLGYREDDRILCPIPFAFDYGWGQVLSLLMTGVSLVLPSPRNSFGLCDAIASHAPTVLAAVPAVLADLTAGLAPIRTVDRSSIRLITNTGSRIARPVFDTACELFPDAAFSLNYGLTETYRSASLPVELARVHPEAVGRAVPGVELDVVDADGTRVPAGVVGEIIHRGAGVFMGYWNDPERTAQVLRPDPHAAAGDAPPVVYTGDLGWYGEDGLLRIEGRRDRQMKSMGVRVSPDEIEVILQQSGLVADAAVVSTPHDVLGDLIVACIVLTAAPSGRTADEHEKTTLKLLKVHAREQMSRYMQPRQYVVLAEFPRTRSAKVDYPALKAQVLARPRGPLA